MIISAFPCTGKTRFWQGHGRADMLFDSDSSSFSWLEPGKRNPDFPKNYIDHIKKWSKTGAIVLVSSHEEVRKGLLEEGLEFLLVYPKIDLKGEYLTRARQRGSPQAFIDLLDSKWCEFIKSCSDQRGCSHYVLSEGEYLSNIDISLSWLARGIR